MSDWPYPYCPHLAYNKNIQIRLASIPYTFVPDPTIDAFTNVNVKCANLDKRNIPTLAYENYFVPQPSSNHLSKEDTNFAKDYYFEIKNVDAIKLDNNIVEETKERLDTQSAYVLASEATKEYDQFQKNRKNALDNARRRAVSVLKMHYQQKEDDKAKANLENSEWLKKLYRKLEQVAKHIIEGDGQSMEDKQRMFLQSKSSLTAGFLSKIKVRNPKAAFDILEELRILMLKKKIKFENQRQQQQKNKSVSMSYTSQASQNVSQGSMLSEATSVNESNIDGEEQIVSKYCDFQALSKKWGVPDVQQVKVLLRLVFTRKFVSDAEVTAIKKKREAEKINRSLQKLNPELSKKIKQKKEANLLKQKNTSHSKFKTKAAKSPVKIERVLKQTGLNKQELSIKEKLLKGGQFDAVGQKFARNRNYSTLFTNKQSKIQYTFKPTPSNKSSKMDSTLNISK